MRLLCWLSIIACAVCHAEESLPPELVVLTQSRGASGEAGGLTLHRLGTQDLRKVAGGLPVPGAVPGPSMQVSPWGDEVWLGASAESGAPPQLLLFGLAPLRRLPLPAGFQEAAKGLHPKGFAQLDGGGMGLVATTSDEPLLLALPRGATVDDPHQGEVQRYPMRGPVLAGTRIGRLQFAMLESLTSELRLSVLDRIGGTERIVASLSPAPARVGTVSLSGAPEGDLVAAAVSSRDLPPGEAERTGVWVLPANSVLSAPVARLEALGSLVSADALCFSGAASLWSVTRLEDSHFGYLTQWCVVHREGASAWEKSAEHILPEFPVRVAVAATGSPLDGIVVGMDDTIALWTGAGSFWEQRLPQTVGALVVDHDVIFAGVGNTVTRLRLDTGEILDSAALQSGHVVRLALADVTVAARFDQDLDGLTDAEDVAAACDPTVDDSDGDGIVDGLDPQPALSSPRLSVEESLVFSGRAAGHELRALLPRDWRDAPLRWQASYVPERLPWLRMYPSEGLSGAPLYLGIDPVEARRGDLSPGEIVLRGFDAATGVEAAGSPASVRVSVSSPPRAAREVLWILPASSAEDGFAEVRDLLSGPPLYLSQRVHQGPHSGGLDGVNVVVLTTESAAQGALSQREVLDYLSSGGALLLTGEVARNAPAYLGHWGAPLGLRMDAGGTLHLDDAQQLPEEQGMPACSRKQVGQGRVALLADVEQLHNTEPEQLRRVRGLFHWLCEAGREAADLDGDGLPNTIEDGNGNGLRDPGETDRFLPDSDRDGLRDQLEDRNANGLRDPGETDPRNPDSDDDGVWDGADGSPVPPFGTASIERIEPAEAPAEGQVELRLTGRALPQHGSYRIGEQEATVLEWLGPEAVRLLAPDSGGREGGLVDVRVADSASERGGVLAGGFRYLPRSTVKLELGARDEEHGAGEGGSIPVRLTVSPVGGAAWRQINATLHSDSRGGKWVVKDPPTGIGVQLYPLPEADDVQLYLHNTGAGVEPVSVGLEWQGNLGRLELLNPLVLAPSGARLALSQQSQLSVQIVR